MFYVLFISKISIFQNVEVFPDELCYISFYVAFYWMSICSYLKYFQWFLKPPAPLTEYVNNGRNVTAILYDAIGVDNIC